MSKSTAGVADPETQQSTKPERKRRTKQKEETRRKRQPPYAVILHNDEVNGMDYVVGVLKKVFGYSTTKSIALMLKTHQTGCAQVWSGALEVAELKADQMRSCGPDPSMADRGAGKLRVSLEPLE